MGLDERRIKMQTIRANKGNWSGEECDIVIQDDGTFTIGMEGYTFRMTSKALSDEDGELGIVHTVRCLEEPSWSWRGYSVPVHGMDIASFEEFSVSREHENPYIAFAQLAWTLI